MRFPFRLRLRGWMAIPFVAVIFVLWQHDVRWQRVEAVSALGAPPPALDAASVSGYVGGMRQLLIPSSQAESQQWIVQTQLMREAGGWRLQSVDYDNAPTGRPVRTPSPYRWWLAAMSGLEQQIHEVSPGLAVERVTRWADPAWHALVVVVSVVLAAGRLGGLAGCVVAMGLALVFPLATAFVPGQPDESGMALAFTLWGVLALLGREDVVAGDRRERFRFAGAGLLSAMGLWLNVQMQVLVLLGLAIGVGAGVLLRRRAAVADAVGSQVPWRAWSVGGAVGVLAAFLVENFPSQLLQFELRSVHPVYAVAWLGLGELLSFASNPGAYRAWPRWKRWGGGFAVLMMMAAVPLLQWIRAEANFWAGWPRAQQLGNLPDGPMAENVLDWITREPSTLLLAATFLPLLFVLRLGLVVGRREVSAALRRDAAWLLGAIVTVAIASGFLLRAWLVLDVLLIAALARAVAIAPGTTRLGWGRGTGLAVAALAVIPGVLAMWPKSPTGTPEVSSEQVQALVERDLAHWLNARAGADGAVVLAPPRVTASLIYHGGLRGLGTPYRENGDGFAAAVRLAAATSPDEAHALVRQRGVTHIVMPSWDGFLDEYAKLGSNHPENTLIGLLRRWLPPRWLRPVPYRLPEIPGFENEFVTLFEVGDVEENATSLARLAEYFVEVGQLEAARQVAAALEHTFPTELDGLVARAQVAAAHADTAEFGALLPDLLAAVNRGDPELLAWDRRASLVTVLAQARRTDLARTQLAECWEVATTTDIRRLTPGALLRLLRLSETLRLSVPEALRQTAMDTLPRDLPAQR